MAINNIVQTIAEARVDARSLSEFMFKPAGFKVTRRLAPTIDTLQFYISRFNALDGDFKSSVSTAVSSLNNSVAEAEGKVSYIETTVQDAINNTAVEGGVLADTFLVKTANGLGQVARNQRDKNSESVSVKDFGALGDGSGATVQKWIDDGLYDSLSAIQTDYPHCNDLIATIDRVCIQSALENKGNIYLPKGKYIVDTALRPRSDTILHGTYESIITYPNGHIATDWSSRFIIYVATNDGANVENVVIRDITVDGNSANIDNTVTPHYHCISVYGRVVDVLDYSAVNNIKITNVNMLNASYDGVYIKWSNNVTVSQCSMFNAGRSCYVIVGATDVKIINNRGTRAQNSYVDFETHTEDEDTKNCLVSGNTFISDEFCNAAGFGLTGLGTQEDIRIESNVFSLNKRWGDYGGSNISITNNTVRCLAGVNVSGALNSTNGSDCKVLNNSIEVFGGSLDIKDLGVLRIRGNTRPYVTGNSIKALSGGEHLIAISLANSYAGDTNNAIVANNRIAGISTGIRDGGEASNISGNNISDGVGSGINSTGTYALIVGNTILNFQTGIVSNYSTGNIINVNNVQGCTTGIHNVNATDSQITNNIINLNAVGLINEKSYSTIINSNTFKGNTSEAVKNNSVSTDTQITSNAFIDNVGSVVQLHGNKVLLKNNIYINTLADKTQAFGFSLNVSSSKEVMVEGNDFSGCVSAYSSLPSSFIVPSVLKQFVDVELIEGALVTTPKTYTFKGALEALNIMPA